MSVVPSFLQASRFACPGTGARGNALIESFSSSLPGRDDLDFVTGPELRLRPAALRHHVKVQRDREMTALIVELGQQRRDTCRGDLALLAIDGHAHCITSLSIWPRSTNPSVSSASAGAMRKPWRYSPLTPMLRPRTEMRGRLS